MSVTCYQLLTLSSFQKITCVAGRSGLYRKLSWPCIAITPSVSQWLRGGELLFITGSFFQTDENSMMMLLHESIEEKLAGIVVLIGGESALVVTDAMRKYADEHDLPLFEMPWDLPLVEVMQQISEMIIAQKELKDTKQRFLLDLVFGQDQPHKYEQLSAFYGIPSHPYLAIAILKPVSQDRVDIEDLLYKFSYYEALHADASDASLITVKHVSSLITLVMAESEKGAQKALDILKRFSEEYVPDHAELFKISKLNLAVSRIVSSDIPVHRLYEEAMITMRVISCAHSVSSQMCYDELGIYKLYFDVPDAVRWAFCKEQIGLLLEEDARSNSSLVNTLLYYLRNGCNASQAAAQLFIHKNTLSYRLNRIQDILGVDLNTPAVRNDLYNALMIWDVFYTDDHPSK